MSITNEFYWQGQAGDGWNVAFTSVAAGSLSLTVPGDGAAPSARAALQSTLNLSPGSDLQFMSQVHGNTVVSIEAPQELPEADGMMSATVPLAVLVADCLPVLLLGRGDSGAAGALRTWAAAVHAGRRGVQNGILTQAVEQLHDAGAVHLSAWIGPGICGKCYEVPAPLRSEVAAKTPAAWASTSWGTPALDLPAAAEEQLSHLGVQVTRVPGCTREDEQLFSHRRAPGAGRFAGVIWRDAPEQSGPIEQPWLGTDD